MRASVVIEDVAVVAPTPILFLAGDAKIEQTLSELDPAKAREHANELDKLLWAIGFSLPLTQSPGNVALRANLANFGPAGIGDLDYTKIGFMK